MDFEMAQMNSMPKSTCNGVNLILQDGLKDPAGARTHPQQNGPIGTTHHPCYRCPPENNSGCEAGLELGFQGRNQGGMRRCEPAKRIFSRLGCH